MRHPIDLGDLTRMKRESPYRRCSDIMDHPTDFMDTYRGRVTTNLFYEPSVRTDFSLQTAISWVGGMVLGFADPKSTSTAEGKTLKGIIRVVSGYANMVVIRNPKEGVTKAASPYSDVPVTNAGDGGHMHLTQVIADLTTTIRLRGRVGGLSMGLCGDLKNGRTVHSFIKVLAKFEGIKFPFAVPRELVVFECTRASTRKHGMRLTEVIGLEVVTPQSDMLYMIRIQWECFIDPLEYGCYKDVYVFTRRRLDRVKRELLVMRPPPRMDEIAIDVDDDLRTAYFEQTRYETYARMALLTNLASQEREKPEPMEIGVKSVCSNLSCITQTEHYPSPLVKQSGGIDCYAYCDKELR